MTGDVLDELGRALRQVRSGLRPGGRLRLITFNMRVHRVVDFGESASAMDVALASLKGGGSSAVFDALAVALTGTDTSARRRLIVLFSDGQDSSSITDAETVLDTARRSASTVAIMSHRPTSRRCSSTSRASTWSRSPPCPC